jgi:large subunit ribosomal protein L24
MSGLKIHSNDIVQVVAGKDKGKRGTVLRVQPEKRRVVVEQANIVKRHTKPRPPAANASAAARQQPSGGVIEKEAAIHVSNVMLVCPACDKPTRVGYKVGDDQRKVRVCRSKGCGAQIDK